MPIYEYKCDTCNRKAWRLRKIDDRMKKEQCEDRQCEGWLCLSLPTKMSFKLNGSCWAKDNYK